MRWMGRCAAKCMDAGTFITPKVCAGGIMNGRFAWRKERALEQGTHILSRRCVNHGGLDSLRGSVGLSMSEPIASIAEKLPQRKSATCGSLPLMSAGYNGDGWYVCRVDTGIGEQYAVTRITNPSAGIAAVAFNPLDSLSDHYKEISGGPGSTPEEAWAIWRLALPVGHAFGVR